jgi:hypothetical protein
MRSPWARIKRPPFFLSVLGASDLSQRSCQKGRDLKDESPKWNLPELLGRPRSGPGGPERQKHANLPAEAKK